MQTALITGANSGIGHALARVLSREGYRLILVGRHKEAIAKVADELPNSHAIIVDLSTPNAAQEVFVQVEKLGFDIDLLVNNAGVGTYGPFWKNDLEAEHALLMTNMVAVVDLTRLILPGMLQRKQGRILNLGSMAAFLSAPYAATYYASKSFILTFSEGLRQSLRGTGVSLTVVCPGPTTGTHFGKLAAEPGARQGFSLPHRSAAQVAEAAYAGLMDNKAVVIPGSLNAAAISVLVHLPRELVARMIGRGQRYVLRRRG